MNNTNKFLCGLPLVLTTMFGILALENSALAVDLNLGNTPLYLGNTVEPNVFFVIDDSGSMSWGDLISHNGQTYSGITSYADWINGYETANITSAELSKLYVCPGFNVLAYNPNVTYTPWSGLDKNNNAYQNQTLSSALGNPFSHTSPTNLTGNYYYAWNDANNNGDFDSGECQINNPINVINLPVDQQTNYANWYSYYRKREYVAKTAYTGVVAKASGVRIGMMTINGNNSVNTPLMSMNTDYTTGNKKNLMDRLFKINSDSSTPLQNALFVAGSYLSGENAAKGTLNAHSNGVTFSDPRLPVSEGGACQQNFTILMTDGYYNSSFDYTVGDADSDGHSQTLADIAMYYYENDLNENAQSMVPTISGIDENSNQHMVTYTVAFGVDGTLTDADIPSDHQTSFDWPAPDSDPEKIDDLRHAAFNGRGHFLNAKNPASLIESINDAIGSILQRTSSAAGIAFNSTAIQTKTVAFQGRYLTTDWSGDLAYLPIGTTGSVGGTIVNAAEKLPSYANRTILTFNATDNKGAAFQWVNLNAAQQTALNDNGNDTLGQNRLAFLRGDQSCEVGSSGTCSLGVKTFRHRNKVLGDIIHSGPAYVGAPNARYDFDNYSTFAENHKDRTPMVYIGSNDGMLHGFDASINTNGSATSTTGTEKIAYVPNTVYKNLSVLSSTTYLHKYFVDGTPAVGDVYFNSNWHTVLVGTLRSGGQGIFALDVTDPSQFNETNTNTVLWEYNDSTDANAKDLGYTFSQASIVKMANGKWAAVIGNGYNSSQADGAAGNGSAVLYIIDIATGTLLTKLDTNQGNGVSFNDPATHGGISNGLSTPAVVDVDHDFIADYIYAGDLYGNMWRFDVTDVAPTNWKVSFNNTPLFSATSVEGKVQPITSRPSVAFNTDQAGYMVYFGTGKYLENGDNSTVNQPTQTFYGLWDKWNKGSTDSFASFARGNLLQQKIVEEPAQSNTQLRITSKNSIDWAVHNGWFIDLVNTDATTPNNQGERQVSKSMLRNGKIIFTTLIPSSAVCEFGGTGWLMELNALDGSRLSESPFDINGDGIYNKDDLVISIAAGGGSGNSKVAASGVKSKSGILSEPELIEQTGALLDYIGIGNSSGTVGLGDVLGGSGGSGSSSGGGTTGTADYTNGSLFGNSRGIPFGRLSWQNLK